MKIRVVRIIEYTYDTVEKMQSDMSRWAAPATGVITWSPGMTIRSTTLPLEGIPDDQIDPKWRRTALD